MSQLLHWEEQILHLILAQKSREAILTTNCRKHLFNSFHLDFEGKLSARMNLDVFGKSSKYDPPPYYPVPPTMKNVIWKSRIALVTYYTWGKEYIAGFKQHDEWLGPYHVEYTPSRPIWEVKQRRAWLVLAWVTGWEYHVFKPSFSLPHSTCKHVIRLNGYFPCLLRNTLPEQGQKN